MSENTAPDVPDLTGYLTGNKNWFSPGKSQSTMLVPSNLQSTAMGILGGVTGGVTGNAVFSGVAGVSEFAGLEKRIATLEETSTHINVAKDQENRICELENAVTELMEQIKIHQEERKKELEEKRLRVEEEMKRMVDLQMTYATQSSQGQYVTQVQNAFANPTAGTSMPPYDSTLDKAKRIFGIK